MDYRNAVLGEISPVRQDDVCPVRERLSLRKAFEGGSSHHHDLSQGVFPEEFHVFPEVAKELSVLSDPPVLINADYEIHAFLLSQTAMGIFSICSPC